MLGFLVRLLPFWVREPLLILVGTVFGVRILYLALVDDAGWVAAAIGAVFLLGTALRVRVVVHALRARRHPASAPSTDDAGHGADAEVTAPAIPGRRQSRQRGVPPRRSRTPGVRRLWPSVSSRCSGRSSGSRTVCRPPVRTTAPLGPPPARHDEDEKLPSAYRATPEP